MTSFYDAAKSAGTDLVLEPDGELYRHSKRPQWGVAILAWERDDVRAYQFEDGRLRKFKEGYFDLLEAVDEIRGSRESVIANLTKAAKTKGSSAPGLDAADPVATFEAQVALFVELYPEGFADEAWVSDHRGTPTGNDLKRHRDPPIQAVRETLAVEHCREMLDDERYDEFMEMVRGILATTDLLPLSQVRMIEGLQPDENRQLAVSIADLLHGSDEYRPRFRGFLRILRDILGARPPWRLATALPALAFPQAQVCVRHSVFTRQAGSLAPRSRFSRRARVTPYEGFRDVAHKVRERLQEAGHEPRDLLDVYDFVWATLRNAALERLS